MRQTSRGQWQEEKKMAVNSSRSMNRSLDAGATDGKYRKVRLIDRKSVV